MSSCSTNDSTWIYWRLQIGNRQSHDQWRAVQPSYLHLISFLPPRSTYSSSVVTLSRPPIISLKITDRSFRYASPRLWNQLPDAFRHTHQSCLDSLPHPLVSPSLSSSLLSSSITRSLQAQNFQTTPGLKLSQTTTPGSKLSDHSRLKTALHAIDHKSFPA